MREKGKLSGILEQRHTALRYRDATHRLVVGLLIINKDARSCFL